MDLDRNPSEGSAAANLELYAPHFKDNVKEALENETLQQALTKVKSGFIDKRKAAADDLDEFEKLRDAARDIKNHSLNHLDLYLEKFETQVLSNGGQVHWCSDGQDAREAILSILEANNAKVVTKGKSMITEEIELNDFLEAQNIEVVETDLGEYIIQLRGEKPSHIIAPAVHVTKDQVEEDFRRIHKHLPADRSLEEGPELVNEARTILRQRYLDADVGITGANFCIAETGATVIVTNEGNGDLTQSLPKVHIVVASIEKIIPTMEDCATLLRVLARSATGQEMSVYTTFSNGPKRAEDLDGPEAFHVILLDNGRSAMLGSEFQEMLRCIRCGACMNHCPVYHSVGGHAYGSTYPGPMGAVLTPSLAGIDKAGHLPNASSFCGRCAEVCPVRIPLPKMMRHWREREFEAKLSPVTQRTGLKLWAFAAKRPKLYRFGTQISNRVLRFLGQKRGRLRSLPLAKGWTKVRDLPTPAASQQASGTFLKQWQKRQYAKGEKP